MIHSVQQRCMENALQLAYKAYEAGEVPVGAVIYCHEEKSIISAAYNDVEKGMNPTNHAEIIAINHACKHKQLKRLSSCDLFVTLEPCMMCAAAVSYAKFKRLYYAAPNKKFGAVESYARYFTESSCNHRPEIYPMFISSEYIELLQSFFNDLRC